MNKKIFTPALWVALGFVVLAAVTRLLPHPANVTPIAAMAIFGGAYFKNKHLAVLLPMIVMLGTDLIIGLHASLWAVYAAFVVTAALGMWMRNRVRLVNVIWVSLASSVIFFLLTNFAVWMSGLCGYPMNGAGLLLCYEMALPFFRNEVLGTLAYSGLMFGIFEFVKSKYPVLSV